MLRHHKRRSARRFKGGYFLLILVIIAAVVFVYLRPIPALTPTTEKLSGLLTAQKINLTWPTNAVAAVGAVNYGVLSTSDMEETQRPIASVAKLITALTVLQKYPLSVGQDQSPLITLGSNDVAIYDEYATEDGSEVKVQAGEQISEYQALQAMLLPSANNIADSLAIWAFGSLTAYASAATQYVQSIGLTNTVIGTDASGFSPSTESTPHDLVLLGIAALQNPVIAQITSQSQATIPVAGTVNNVNSLLGTDDIIGIKTGNTDQAGGVYVFAAKDSLGPNNSITIVGAVQNAPTLQAALSDSLPLLDSIKTNFTLATIVRAHEVVAYYNVPWQGKVNVISAQDIITPVWDGVNYPIPVTSLNNLEAPQKTSSNLGTIGLPPIGSGDKVSLTLAKPIASAPWWWRIIRHKL